MKSIIHFGFRIMIYFKECVKGKYILIKDKNIMKQFVRNIYLIGRIGEKTTEI